MSFEPIEKSDDLGSPYELYEFRYGDTDEAVYRYTNLDRDLVADGVTWFARPIRREAYKSSGKTEKTNLSIRLPITTDLAKLFTDFPPTQVVRVIIRAGHVSDPENNRIVVWVGRVLSVAKEENEAVLTCDSTIVSMKRPGLRRNYQYACPYVLYGQGVAACNASMAAATKPAVVAAITGGVVILQGGWQGGIPFVKFSGGMLRWRGATGWEFRTIRTVSDSGDITYIGPVRGLEVGQAIEVILGCNHTMTDCRDLHGNIQNYGGQPWIPTKNPVRYHPYW